MPGPMSDCYVLAPNRSARLALEFLDSFVPAREPTWDAADPAEVLGVALDSSMEVLLEFLEQHVERAYSLCLRSTRTSPPYYAILAFNEDGSLILGLSGDEDERAAAQLLGRLEQFVDSPGYWSVEEAPAAGRQEFLARLERQP